MSSLDPPKKPDSSTESSEPTANDSPQPDSAESTANEPVSQTESPASDASEESPAETASPATSEQEPPSPSRDETQESVESPAETPAPESPRAESSNASHPTTTQATGSRRALRWAWVLAPMVAIWEFCAHVASVRGVPKTEDWEQARGYVQQNKREGDLVSSAPLWTDPLARKYFKGLISLADAARPDADRYKRAWVATIRNGENPDFKGWREASTQQFGKVTVRLLENPAPVNVLYDFVQRFGVEETRVTRGNDPCQWADGLPVEGGGLGQGALAGPQRFLCGAPWNYVGKVIIEDMDHRGRQCLWSHPVVAVPMRTVFPHARIGRELHGHHAIAYEAERGGDKGETGPDVNLDVYVAGQHVGHDTHKDGQGWKVFSFDTSAWNGTEQEVVFEVNFDVSGNRHYCFQAETR